MSLFNPSKTFPEPPTALGRLRVFSPTAGIRMSPLQLGAMSFGEAWKGGLGSLDKEGSYKMLDAFYDAGGRSIDTANIYQNEESEEWVGDWMQERGVRDQIVLLTKFTCNYKSYEVGPINSANYAGNHKKSLHVSLRDSLKKLKTDYYELMIKYDYTTSVEEVMNALDDVVRSGKVLYLGVSDSPAWWVATCNTYARAHGKNQFVVYQGKWNIMDREFEREIIPMAKHFGMALAPWGAIGSGKLRSKKQMAEQKNSSDGRGGAEQTEEEKKYSEVLSTIAEKHGLESPTAIALAYLLQKVPYCFPIVGGRQVAHLMENIKAIEVELSPEEIAEIEGVKKFEVGFPHNFLGPDPHEVAPVPGIVASQRGTLDYVPAQKAISLQKRK